MNLGSSQFLSTLHVFVQTLKTLSSQILAKVQFAGAFTDVAVSNQLLAFHVAPGHMI